MPDGSDTPRLEARLMRVEFSGRVVLDAVNFAVSAGEIAVLQGPSGSGKSTFLRALATLEPFAAGSLWLEGREVLAGDFTATRVEVAYVPQFPVMFGGSVAENVRTGPRLRGAVLSDAEVEQLLRRVSLDPAFGSRVARDLSGGEKQRVAIARALANAPKVILLDEPTSALDPASTDGILSLIRSCAAEGLAVVVVTHLAEQAARLGGTHYVLRPRAHPKGLALNYIDIAPWRLLVVLALVLVTSLWVSKRAQLGLERELLIGIMRGALQLLLVGYVLTVLFASERAAWVLLMLSVMLAVGAWTSAHRVDQGPRARVLLPRALAAICAGSFIALVPVFALVIRPDPLFDGRTIIPISGMIVANAMNVVAQVNQRIFASVRSEAAEIEQWLALGATPKQAIAKQVRDALRSALIPTINGLLTVGLVSLPGMMTGQIMSGIAPEHAIRYQLVIMYQLVVVAAVSGAVSAWLARRLLFNASGQMQRFG